MKCLLVAIVGFVFAVAPVAHARSRDDEFCKILTDMASARNAEGPKMVDHVTRDDGMAVLCSLKAVEFKKFMFASQAEMRPGWRERKAKQWNDIYCNGATRENIEDGWTIALVLVLQDGTRFRHAATCS